MTQRDKMLTLLAYHNASDFYTRHVTIFLENRLHLTIKFQPFFLYYRYSLLIMGQ